MPSISPRNCQPFSYRSFPSARLGLEYRYFRYHQYRESLRLRPDLRETDPALGLSGNILMAISTSGNSPNILRGLQTSPRKRDFDPGPDRSGRGADRSGGPTRPDRSFRETPLIQKPITSSGPALPDGRSGSISRKIQTRKIWRSYVGPRWKNASIPHLSLKRLKTDALKNRPQQGKIR